MKNHNLVLPRALAVAFVMALVVAGFFAARAYASTGCFSDTNGLATESFICWMKERGITSGCGNGNYCPGAYVTRSQMAVFMNKLAQLPPETGLIRVVIGPSAWRLLGSNSGAVTSQVQEYYTLYQSSNIMSGYSFIVTPELPTGLYGRNLNIAGVEYCYSSDGTVVSYGFTVTLHSQTGGAYSSPAQLVSDGSSFVDTACRYYSITPTPLNNNSTLSIRNDVYWAVAGAAYTLGRVTLYLQPTTSTFTIPVAP